MERRAAATELDFARVTLILLCAAAIVYGFLAGLRSLSEFDLGWQLATGRWVVEHRQIPSVDVFSYTVTGKPWIYPVGSSLLFYLAYRLGGWSILSWLHAVVCAGTVSILLRRPSLPSAVLAVLAVPAIAIRTRPRADMFTVILFAAFLALLSEQFRSGRSRLWLLPLLMIVWVNLHLGFIAGFALIAGYFVLELAAMISVARRADAVARLWRAWPWLIATFPAALLNPWGFGIVRALLAQERMAAQIQTIPEWGGTQLNWTTISLALSLREPGGALYLLLLVTSLAILVALLRRQWGEAAWLAGAAALAVQYIRFEALFAAIAVVVAGAVFSTALVALPRHVRQARWWTVRSAPVLGCALALSALALAALRSADLVDDRAYLAASDLGSFGTGLSWWFPERAMAFISRENIPGEIFNTYNEGGYFTWRLGGRYRDYIDGRLIPFGADLFERSNALLATPPDSPEWQEEARRYDINVILVPLGRYEGLQLFPELRQFCTSELWAPVYLDEVAAIFLRRQPENQAWLTRFPIRCDTVPLPAEPQQDKTSLAFNDWANAAAVLQALGRNGEAFAATSQALAIFPDNAYLHFVRGDLWSASGRGADAEAEYRQSLALEPNGTTWSRLAALFHRERRREDEIAAWRRASALLPFPAPELLALGYAELGSQHPEEALADFDRAAANLPPQTATGVNRLRVNLAFGRGLAWSALGDVSRAISFQEETVRLAPERADAWLELMRLYERVQRFADSQRARDRAAAIASELGQPRQH
jgi:tetratricopeptide (TPR) repeat protein